ncbi:hypothetical protein B4144_3247 [Bacillus atrophaeus]|nr:hypothetical protein B4144_3247 [Bacillus atrophaeus]
MHEKVWRIRNFFPKELKNIRSASKILKCIVLLHSSSFN